MERGLFTFPNDRLASSGRGRDLLPAGGSFLMRISPVRSPGWMGRVGGEIIADRYLGGIALSWREVAASANLFSLFGRPGPSPNPLVLRTRPANTAGRGPAVCTQDAAARALSPLLLGSRRPSPGRRVTWAHVRCLCPHVGERATVVRNNSRN